MEIKYLYTELDNIDSEILSTSKYLVDVLNNRIARVKNPLITTDLDIPKNRAIHINMLNPIEEDNFNSLEPINNMDRERLLIYNVLKVDKPLGKVVIKKKDYSRYESEMRRSFNKLKTVKAKDKVVMTSKDVMVFNYKLLYSNYVYQQQKLRNYYMLRNNLSTLVDEINERGVFDYNIILLESPNAKIDVGLLNRWTKIDIAPSMDSAFKSIDSLLVFELWKMFFKVGDSVFKNIKPERLGNTYITLHTKGMYTTYRLLDLLGMSNETNVEGRIKSIRAIDAAKLLLLSINKFTQRSLLSEMSKGIINNVDDDDDTIFDLDSELAELGINHKEELEDEDGGMADAITNEVDNIAQSTVDTRKRDIRTFIDTAKPIKELLVDGIEESTKVGIISKNENAKLSEILMNQDDRVFMINGKETKLSELLDYSNVSKENRYIPLKDSDTIIDKEMLSNANRNYDKEYLAKLYYKDLYNAIYSIQNGKVIITDHTVEYKNGYMGGVEKHILHLKPLKGKPSTVMFPLPVINPDTETYKMSGNEYLMRIQRKDNGIRKTSPTTVLLTSYNGKLFIEKNIYQKTDPSVWFSKHIAGNDLFTNLILRANIPFDLDLPKAYTLVSGGVSRFTYDNKIDFMFDYKNRLSLVDVSEQKKIIETETKNKLVLIGRNIERTTRYFMNKDGLIISESKGVFKDKGDLEGYFRLDLKDSPIESAAIMVLGKAIPIGLILLQYLGLDGLVKLLGNKPYVFYTYEDKYKPTRDEYIIKLKDGMLVFKRKDTKSGLIFYGLPKEVVIGFNYSDLNNKEAITTMFNIYGLSIAHINFIMDMETLFLDNITKDSLLEMKEPTDMHRLLIRAIEMLVDDNYKNPNNIHDNELVRYERIAGLVNKSLSRAVQSFNNRNTLSKARITLDPYEIWKNIGDDSTSMLVENNNPIATIKQRDNVTYLGEFGRNKITMTLATRIMTPDEVGTISEASPDSGDSGISTYLTHSAEIRNLRGMVNTIDMSKYSINKALSSANIVNAFIIHDSPNRINFASIQSSHLIPMRVMRVNRLLTGAEPAIASKVGKPFVYTAEANGVVVKVIKDSKIEVEYSMPRDGNKILLLSDVNDNVFIRAVYEVLVNKGYIVTTEVNDKDIKYKVYIGTGDVSKEYIKVKENTFLLSTLKGIPEADTIKTKKAYSLRPWSSKVEGNSSIKHTMTTHLSVGSKVSLDEAITYDSGFFEINIYDPKSLLLKLGNYIKLAFIEDKYTYEDSIMFSKDILEDVGEVVYKVLSKVVDVDSHIANILPEGTKVKYGMKLMTIMDSNLANNTNISDRAREIMADTADKSPKAKSNGVIDRIDVIYNCELEDMDSTVRALADASNKRFKEENNTDGRVTNEYSINGKPLMPGEIELKYYISTMKAGIIGDKFIAIHQLKNTLGTIVDEIKTEDGEKLDGVFGGRSMGNRIVDSSYIIGTSNTLFGYYTKLATKAYRGA